MKGMNKSGKITRPTAHMGAVGVCVREKTTKNSFLKKKKKKRKTNEEIQKIKINTKNKHKRQEASKGYLARVPTEWNFWTSTWSISTPGWEEWTDGKSVGVDGCINTLLTFEDWKMTTMKGSGKIFGQMSGDPCPTDTSAVVMTPWTQRANTGALLDQRVPRTLTHSADWSTGGDHSPRTRRIVLGVHLRRGLRGRQSRSFHVWELYTKTLWEVMVCSDQCQLCCATCCWNSDKQTSMKQKNSNKRKYNIFNQKTHRHKHTHTPARLDTHTPIRIPTHTPTKTRPHPHTHAHAHTPRPYTANTHIQRLVFFFKKKKWVG